jgi:hypothetical protein
MEINEAPGDGSFWGGVVDTTGIAHNLNSTNGLITTNSFQHLAMTYDKASGVAALYRNGVAVAVTNLGVFTPQTSFDFFLGNRPSGFFTGNYFQGKMDEVSVYNRALSGSEIQSIYNAGSAGKTPDLHGTCHFHTTFQPDCSSGRHGHVQCDRKRIRAVQISMVS